MTARRSTFLGLVLLTVLSTSGCASILVLHGAGITDDRPDPPKLIDSRAVRGSRRTVVELTYTDEQPRFVQLATGSSDRRRPRLTVVPGPLPDGEPWPVPIQDGEPPTGGGLWVDRQRANTTRVVLSDRDGRTLARLDLSLDEVGSDPGCPGLLILLPAAVAFDVPMLPLQLLGLAVVLLFGGPG